MKFSETDKTRQQSDEDAPDMIKTEFSCSNCDRVLINTMRVKEKPSSVNLRVHCSSCEDFSFTKPVSGEFYVTPAEGIKLLRADTSEDNTLHTIYTETDDV